MTLIAKNLKTLRKHHSLTQDQFAQRLGIKRSSIGAYEEGRAEPPISNLSNIARSFDVSIDSLVYEDLESTFGLNPLTGQKQKMNSEIAGVPLKILAITVDKSDKENVEFIPQKAVAGYLNGFSDPDYLRDLPKFNLPNLPNGTYRAFEINGESMLPINSGSIIIGRYIENEVDLKEGDRYIFISRTEGIVFKRLFMEDEISLRLVSDNPNFSPYKVKKEDILEVWHSYAMITTSLPEPGIDLNLNKIEKTISNVAKDIGEIKTRLFD